MISSFFKWQLLLHPKQTFGRFSAFWRQLNLINKPLMRRFPAVADNEFFFNQPLHAFGDDINRISRFWLIFLAIIKLLQNRLGNDFVFGLNALLQDVFLQGREFHSLSKSS